MRAAVGQEVCVTITVLDETKQVAGVETRVVEERETADGKPAETSRNYFAVGAQSHNLYYFGEDVDNYRDGKVINHESAWLAGKRGARFGLVSQMRRCAVSVPANIAEAFARKSRSDKARVINIAQGSLEELRYYFRLSADLGYTTILDEVDKAQEVGRMLGAYARTLLTPNS